MVARAAIVACALAACSVPGVDYTGKACPCPSGYACNTTTQTCARELPQDARGDSITPPRPDGAVDAAVTNSCIVGAYAHLSYATPTFADYATAWTVGNGNWSNTLNEAEQQNSAVTLAYTYHSASITGNANYRIVATMHDLDNAKGDVLGLAMRIDPLQDRMYSCEYLPQDGKLLLVKTSGLVVTTLASTSITDTGKVTLEMQASASTLQCCLHGSSGTTNVVTDSTLTSGPVGVMTSMTAAGFSDFSLYTP